MKKVSIIFIYISIVLLSLLITFFFIFALTGIIYYATDPYYNDALNFGMFLVYMILAIIFCVVGITVGVLTLKRLKVAKTKNEMLSLSILCLIFCNIISGILLLCMEDKDFDENFVEAPQGNSINKLEEKLLKLEKMKNDGLITQEEYVELRKKAIDSGF